MAKERTVEEIHIQIGDVRYTLTGGSFAEMVEKVKAVPGRRFRAIPNDKHWVLPVTLETAEVALSPYLLTAVGKALKVAIMDPTSMPTSPDEALPLLQENHALLEKIIQDLRDAAFLLNRNPSHHAQCAGASRLEGLRRPPTTQSPAPFAPARRGH